MLFGCPISREVADACLIAKVDGFVCSINQVGPSAYTGFTHESWARFLHERNNPDVYVERDHLGKGGEDWRWWIDEDVKHGFTGVHLHYFNVETAKDPVEYAWDKGLRIQLGPGEDSSKAISPDLWRLPCDWISFPTGCLIANGTNIGRIDETRIEWERQQWKKPIRGHNCDYLKPHLMRRIGRLVEGVNVAPQFGVIQSCYYLMTARSRGYDIQSWLDACEADEKNHIRWGAGPEMVGHYHFRHIEWREDVYNECVATLAHEIALMKQLVGGSHETYNF
jgi:hypothetical protein